MFCPSCGTESLPEHKFCKTCGATLHGAGDTPNIAAPVAAPPPQAVPVPPPAQFIPPTPPTQAQYPPPPPAAYPPPPPPPAAYPPPPVYVAYPQAVQPSSKGSAIRNVVVILFAVISVVGGIVYYVQNAKKVIIGTKDEVFYSGSATKDQATALGNALKGDGYFQDKGVTVLLDKGSSDTTISFVVKDGYWNEPGTLSSFEEIVRTLASTVGGFPVQLKLDNTDKVVEKSSTVGKVDINSADSVYYEGTATQAQAQAVGDQLKTDGFFTGKGADVFLIKHDDGTTISFVIGDGTWNDPQIVSDFEILARSLAPAAGGLPIELHLTGNDLVVKKDEKIN